MTQPPTPTPRQRTPKKDNTFVQVNLITSRSGRPQYIRPPNPPINPLTTRSHLEPLCQIFPSTFLFLRELILGDGRSCNWTESAESFDTRALPSSSAPSSEPSLDCGGSASANERPWNCGSTTTFPWLIVLLLFLKNDRLCCRWYIISWLISSEQRQAPGEVSASGWCQVVFLSAGGD
jgi:hypothetical protein